MGKNSAEVVSIGNELLIGHTLDTNSFWIGKKLTQLGWKLERVTQVRDSLEAIKDCVNEALRRGPTMLFTVGGLGPTHDDMTLRGLSLALKRPLDLNAEALHLIREKYALLDRAPSLNRFRRKMAKLPRGSIPLPNLVGTAPGVLTKIGRTTMISLPGVPSEMKSIFTRSVVPVLRQAGAKRPEESRVRIVGVFESTLAPVLARARRKFPMLYFKSHPKGRETGVRSLIELHVYSTGEGTSKTIKDALSYVLRELRRTVRTPRPRGW